MVITLLIEEAGLFIGDSKFTIDGGEDALYLSEGEHTTQESIACIMTMRRLIHDTTGLVGKGHTMIDTHGQLNIGR